MALEFDVNERPEPAVSGGRSSYTPEELDKSSEGKPSQPESPTNTKDGGAPPNNEGGASQGTGKSFLAMAEASHEKRQKADQAAMASLSGLKVLGNAINGVLHHSKGASEEELDQRVQKMLEYFADQSVKLHDTLGLPDMRYVRESVTGSLAKVISQDYQISGEAALNRDWAGTLSQLASMDGVWEPSRGDDDWTTMKSAAPWQ